MNQEIQRACEEIRQGIGWIDVSSEDGTTFDITIHGAMKSQAKAIIMAAKALPL